jgi:5-methylthioribose kinase
LSSGDAFEDTRELLSLDESQQVLETLQAMGVCDSTESVVDIGKAGEGNMNLVLRVTTDRRSVIVKQARPWVEKYPTIAAPAERILAEIDFYERVSDVDELRTVMPSVVATAPQLRLLVLEDLGEAADYTCLYDPDDCGQDADAVFKKAANWIARLHRQGRSSGGSVGCDALRELNHAHMFSIPLSDPPVLDLDSVCDGLESASRPLRVSEDLRDAIDRLGETYLRGRSATETVLLHGDYYPGSWLRTNDGFRVIDPEFCFRGPREFDLGVMAAHRIFCHAAADVGTIEQLCQDYGHEVSTPLVGGFAGVELIRRLIGVAQLPLVADLACRQNWLALGEHLVMRAV